MDFENRSILLFFCDFREKKQLPTEVSMEDPIFPDRVDRSLLL